MPQPKNASAPGSLRLRGGASAGRRISRFSVLLAANLFVLSLFLFRLPFFEAVELRTQDLRLRTRGERPVHPDIAVIEIEKATIDDYALKGIEWPIPRDQYALLLAALDGWGARAVGVDLWFSGRDKYEDRNDTTLAAVTAVSPSVIHAVYWPLQMPAGRSQAAGREGPKPNPLWDRLFAPLASGWRLMTTVGGQFDMPRVLADELRALGHIALTWGADNVARYAPLLVEHEGRAVPALSLVMASRYLGTDWKQARIARGGPFVNDYLVLEAGNGARRIPVDRHGRVLINFPGTEEAFPKRFTFVTVANSAKDWIEGKEPRPGYPKPEEFAGKVVLVCNTASNLLTADVGPTPFSDNSPLAFAHASVVNSILRQDYLRPAPEGYEYVAWGILALALGLLLPALAPEILAAVSLAGLLGCVVIAWALLVFAGVQITMVPPMFIILSLSIGVLLRGYVLRDRERHAAEQELQVARRVQQGLLPTGPLEIGEVQVSGLNLPCFAVGGDYFDYFKLADGRIALAIGDVAGKGIPAALLMSKLQAILRGECAHEFTVPEVPERANRLLMESSEGSTKFITFFFATLDPKTRELRYTNAGHNPPVLLRRDGAVEFLETGGFLLGIFPMATYDEGVTELRPGDVLFLFTDGVTEAEDRRKAQYGDDRLLEVLRAARASSAREIGETVCESVVRFSYGLHMADDLTLVAVKVSESAAAPA